MRVAILHNPVADDATVDTRDVLIQVETVRGALHRLGHQTLQFACGLNLESLRTWLQRRQPDVVFNLVESFAGSDRLVFVALAVLDAWKVPYTGNPTEAIFLTNYKLIAKERMCQAGLPTPGWLSLEGSSWPPTDFHAPAVYIVKPVSEHASLGMDESSLVTCGSRAALRKRIRERSARLGRRCFAEEYIDGREFNVAMLAGPEGPQLFPPAEIEFSAFPPGKPRIVDYRAKWEEDTFEYCNTPRTFDFPPADQPLLERLQRLARRCWDLFGLAGYVRVDFRVDRQGQPWILEINTNPCLSPDGGFDAAAELAGLNFDQVVTRLLDDALERKSAGRFWAASAARQPVASRRLTVAGE